MTASTIERWCGSDETHTMNEWWQCWLWASLFSFQWSILLGSGPMRWEDTLSNTCLECWWVYLHRIWKPDEEGAGLIIDYENWEVKPVLETTWRAACLWTRALGPSASEAEFSLGSSLGSALTLTEVLGRVSSLLSHSTSRINLSWEQSLITEIP